MRDFLYFFCRQSDQQGNIIRLDPRFIRRAIALDLSAFFAAVNDHISFFGVGLDLDRPHNTAAAARAIAGVDINV